MQEQQILAFSFHDVVDHLVMFGSLEIHHRNFDKDPSTVIVLDRPVRILKTEERNVSGIPDQGGRESMGATDGGHMENHLVGDAKIEKWGTAVRGFIRGGGSRHHDMSICRYWQSAVGLVWERKEKNDEEVL